MMLSASSSSATVAVEKATSDLLIGPDWTMNIDICDSVNSHHWQAKDVVKALKKRLQHKNSKVQLLALTLLETMVKNCGDYVHFQIAERNILGEMVKIVRKKADMQVRDKILVLLDSWQEAFGGPGGRHPQYYFAYEELRRSGVMFPQRLKDAAPIFTPPANHLMTRSAGYGMPSNSSRRLDETMATEFENLSMSNLDSMWDVVELLSDMLQAVNPGDIVAVKDEIIVDLVSRCRSNQKKLMQMLTTTGDEELLARGLELNDSLQNVLSKHDAIASGSSLPNQVANISPKPAKNEVEVGTSGKQDDVKDSSPRFNVSVSAPVANSSPRSNVSVTAPVANSSPRTNVSVPAPVAPSTKGQVDEEDDEEDDFAQLARRHSKTQPSLGQSTTAGTIKAAAASMNSATSYAPSASVPNTCTALALPSQPEPVRTNEQDIIDLLSLTLSTSNPYTPETPSSSYHNMHQVPASPSTQQQPYASQTYPGHQGQAPYNTYVVPWAQSQSQPQTRPQQQFQPQPQFQVQSHHHIQPESPAQPQFHLQSRIQAHSQFQPQQNSSQYQAQPQVQSQFQASPQLQLPLPNHLQPQLPSQAQNQGQHPAHFRSMSQPQYPQFSSASAYPPPPWAATPGYFSTQNSFPLSYAKISSPQPSNVAPQAARPSQLHSSYSFNASNGSTMGDPRVNPGTMSPAVPGGQKPFIPSYRLFEDLNVLGNGDARHKMPNGAAPSLSGAASQGMVGFRK